MISLGIESTAHTFGVGIITDKAKILANERDTYTTKTGGIIPRNAVQHHIEVCDTVLQDALDTAGITIHDIDIVSFSQSPGIGHTLRVGAMFARSLSLLLKKPLVGVNHCIAHLEIGRALTKAKDPILLYASGANTQVIGYEGKKYRVFGETLDMGIGNMLDAFARTLGIGFPGGPKVYELSLKSKNYTDIPYVIKGMDVSFGGILTHSRRKALSGEYSKEDLCYSLQETVFAMLVEVTERAMAHTGKQELLLGGGVACNKRLQEMCSIMCKERKAKFYVPDPAVLIDNGLMIAWQGLIEYKAGKTTPLNTSSINPHERTDDVDVAWRK